MRPVFQLAFPTGDSPVEIPLKLFVRGVPGPIEKLAALLRVDGQSWEEVNHHNPAI